jgi:ABC-type phosphate/phosphonate transport system permease subunit
MSRNRRCRNRKPWLIAGTILCLLLATPLATEFEVQKAERHLKRSPKLSDFISAFGPPSREGDDDSKKTLSARLNLKIEPGDHLLIFHREGIPYWGVYIVTNDNETIKSYAVDRLW